LAEDLAVPALLTVLRACGAAATVAADVIGTAASVTLEVGGALLKVGGCLCAALLRVADCALADAMAALASAYEKVPAADGAGETVADGATGVDAPDIGLEVRCLLAALSMCAILRTSHESLGTVRRRAPLG